MLMAQLAGVLSSSASLPMFLFTGSALAESEVFKSSAAVVCFSFSSVGFCVLCFETIVWCVDI